MNDHWKYLKVSCTELILLVMPFGKALADDTRKPNALFISVDDLKDWAGCLRDIFQTRTPNIDCLAASGMLFTNAHCAAPACNPSRTAIMTGISPYMSGL